MSKLQKTDPIIVIIATSFFRTNLLLERSLKSVYKQKNINPHQIYIVDDNSIKEGQRSSDEYGKIKTGIKTLREEILKPELEAVREARENDEIVFDNFFHTTLIKNTRTKGFSGAGAWNSGAFKALHYSDRNYFLAFLDDDDEWENNYLEKLYESIKTTEKKRIDGKVRNIKAIASVSGFLRIEKNKKIPIQASIKNFTKNNFFIGNPGLQGSNLFIELKSFWAIGGFDESLKSATDRDLAIRLIEYNNIRPSKKIEFIDEILVKHYTISENRVSTNFNNKKKGLDIFYRKYFHQFSKELQNKSLLRAEKLFNYNINIQTEEIKSNKNITNITNLTNTDNTKPFNLIVGAISDNSRNLTELLKSFLVLYNKYGKLLKDYRFFILENTDNEYEIRPIINYFNSKKKLKIELLKNTSNGTSIAENRTFLQKQIYKKGKVLYDNDYVSWIIDDDHLFKYDTENEIIIPNYFKIIAKQSNNGIDAMFGLISDAAPLPFLNTLRVQLVDLYYNLTYFSNCNPSKGYNLNKLQQVNIKQDEFYYDLSEKNFQHLEYPYYFQTNKRLNSDAFVSFLSETTLLSKGVNVFRKLTFKEEAIGEITKKSIYRGGNTVIFNPELLKTPNYTPERNYNRRSDFNWAIINREIFNKELYEVVLPLKHYRRLQKTSLITNENKLQADIKGLIFYRFFEKMLVVKNWESKTEYKAELKHYEQIKKNVFLKIKINNYRIQTLIHLILNLLKNKRQWWFQDKYVTDINYLIQQNILTMEVLRIELGRRKFQKFIIELENNIKIDNTFVNNVRKSIKDIKKQN